MGGRPVRDTRVTGIVAATTGATVGLEMEVDSSLVDQPRDLHQRIARLFRLAKTSVDRELAAQIDASSWPNTDIHHQRVATENQMRAIKAIAERQNLDLGEEVRTRFGVCRLDDLSLEQASQLIDATSFYPDGGLMFRRLNHKTWILWITLIAATHGCDDRSTQIAREAADRQAQQNTTMAELNKEVASGTHRLAEADAQARKEIVGVHHELQAERTQFDTSRSELESERRQIAGQRRTESTLVSLSTLVGGVSLVIALLGFCWYALVATRRGDDTYAQLNELLVQELLADQPLKLPVDQPLRSLLGHTGPAPPSKE